LQDGLLDLDAATRDVLALDTVLDWVAEHARTEPGRERIRATTPSADLRTIDDEAQAVRELTRLVAREGPLVPGGLPDPGPGLAALAVEGAALSAGTLSDVARVATAAADLAQAIARLDPAPPGLRARAAEIPDLRRLVQPILRAIEPDGSIRDDASPELREVRAARRTRTERLERQLLSFAREPGSESVVRDDFVTERNGRFVIPIRTDTPRPVAGIVHASSSSGATQFVEPLEAVEANNEIVRLREREEREVERLLRAFSEGLAQKRDDLVRGIDALAALDATQARALFAREIEGELARVGSNEPIELVGLRHPLLERRLAAAGASCVPLDLQLDPADRVLVLSGPNAGGKTVALKTLGLAALLAQAAIPLPARSARLPLFRQIRADVGDRQSIAADLSTFTAHVRAVAGYLRDAAPPCLFLLDEIGTGTEPREGAALSLAILEELRCPGVTVAVTTHQAEIKTWALTEAGVESAALEFDPVELRPTFRVIQGTAGISAGLDIARRVGLSPSIVERARARMGGDATRSEELVRRLRERVLALEARAQELEQARLLAAASTATAERERRAEIERERARASSALASALAAFDAESRRAIAEIEARGASATTLRTAERQVARVRERHAHLAADLAARGGAERPAIDSPVEGQRVHVASLGRDGRVVAVRGAQVEVLLGRLPFTVARSDLRAPEGPTETEERPTRTRSREPSRAPMLDEEPPAEILLLGATVEEAVERLDAFLDRAALAGLVEVRVVHGHGTGRLRKAIRTFLDRHVHVSAHRPGQEREGGDGATMVTLR
jgi:DNA mismatch repair protein MutS2